MFELDENIPNATCTVKVAGIGKTKSALEKVFPHANITLLTEEATAPESWSGTDIGFLIGDDSEANAWDKFQKTLQNAKQQNVLPIPIFITEKPSGIADSIMLVNPKNFADEATLYAYIGKSILSIQSFIAQPGFVNLDLEDIRELYNCAGRLSFTYGEYCAATDMHTAVQQATQRLTTQNIAPKSGKFMILNITGSEDQLSMVEICELSELIHDAFGTDDCNMIWGANFDNTLADKVRLSLWIKY